MSPSVLSVALGLGSRDTAVLCVCRCRVPPTWLTADARKRLRVPVGPVGGRGCRRSPQVFPGLPAGHCACAPALPLLRGRAVAVAVAVAPVRWLHVLRLSVQGGAVQVRGQSGVPA